MRRRSSNLRVKRCACHSRIEQFEERRRLHLRKEASQRLRLKFGLHRRKGLKSLGFRRGDAAESRVAPLSWQWQTCLKHGAE